MDLQDDQGERHGSFLDDVLSRMCAAEQRCLFWF